MRRWSIDGFAVAVGLALGGLYVTTLTPGLANDGGDGHELTVVAATLGLAHPTGYPLYTWIGHLFTLLPVGEIAYRTNLMSAVFGGATGALVFLVARRLDLSRGVAVWTALLHGVTTTFWSQAVITEVYATNAFMVMLTLLLALRWADAASAGEAPATVERRFVAFALVYGLSFGTHMSNAGFAPFYALFVLVTDWRIVTRPRTVLLGTLAFALGLAQFAWLPFKAHGVDIFPNTPPDTVPAFLDYTVRAFAGRRFAFPLASLPARIVDYMAVLGRNFTVIGVVLGFVGMWSSLRRDVVASHLLIGMWLVHVVVFSQMFLPDLDVFFIPSDAVFALFVGFGADALMGAVALLRGPSWRALRATAVLGGWLVLATLAHAGYRDNDRSADTCIPDFQRSVFASLPSGSILVPKGRGLFGSAVTYWQRIRHLRPDVVALTDPRAAPRADAPVFVERTRAPVGLPVPKGTLVPVIRGNEPDLVLYRVEPAGWDPTERAPVESGSAQDLRVATLVGFEHRRVRDDGPLRVHVRALWRLADCRRPAIVSTSVDTVMLEAHLVGGANACDVDAAGRVIVDEYDAVVPRAVGSGTHALTLGTVELGASTVALHPGTPVSFTVE